MEPYPWERFYTPREQSSNFGLAVWHAMPRYMADCHQHNDLEVNLLLKGQLTYLHSGSLCDVKRGDTVIFWAGRPHQAVNVSDDAVFYGFSIPLGWVLNWHLPEVFTQQLLGGEMLFPPVEGPVAELPNQMPHWLDDMVDDSSERRKTMLLEMEAWLHRAAQGLGAVDPLERTRGAAMAHGPMGKVEQMARHISEHYMEPLSVREVAHAVGLHENYAATLFHKRTGATLVDFIAKQRLGHAQMLLATTDMKVLRVALDAGFGSASRFYAVFKTSCGMSPSEYRRAIQASRLVRPGR